MASLIVGMGDVVSLVEKATAEVSDADVSAMTKDMFDATFDFVNQSELITNMRSFADVAKMIPGIGGQIDTNQIAQVEKRLKKNKAMIGSMTKKERSNPDLFDKDRSS